MAKKLEAPEWFFMWSKPKGKEYITMICHWTRGDLIKAVEREMHRPWSHIYRMSGRAIRCKVVPTSTRAND